MDLSVYDTAKTADGGAVLEVRHPGTGAKLKGVRITLLGADSPRRVPGDAQRTSKTQTRTQSSFWPPPPSSGRALNLTARRWNAAQRMPAFFTGAFHGFVSRRTASSPTAQIFCRPCRRPDPVRQGAIRSSRG